MNIFELFGKIGINNKEANRAIDETTGKAEGGIASLEEGVANENLLR